MQRRHGFRPPRRIRTCPESVALGEVGIVGSWEVSRLSRTDKDWCRLLEVCQIFGTLIADEQQIYDLNYLDDQLVLGIKGTLSVVELKVLRQRMQAGQESKARRGELFKRLPVGYVLDAMGKVVFHPDRRVYEALQLVFIKFRELWSVRQTFQWFRDHDVELPANPIQGTRLVWKIPVTEPDPRHLVQSVLCWRVCMGTPAGGDRAGRRQAGEASELQCGERRNAGSLSAIITSGILTGPRMKRTRRMIRRNSVNWQGDESMAAIRAGQGLLVGLLRCGHCGRKLTCATGAAVAPTRVISARETTTMADSIASVLVARRVDRRLGQEVLKVISPFGVEASLKALEELSAGDAAQRASTVQQTRATGV